MRVCAPEGGGVLQQDNRTLVDSMLIARFEPSKILCKCILPTFMIIHGSEVHGLLQCFQ